MKPVDYDLERYAGWKPKPIAGTAGAGRYMSSAPSFHRGPSCACCYRPVKDHRATYCSRTCREAHKRLRGAA